MEEIGISRDQSRDIIYVHMLANYIWDKYYSGGFVFTCLGTIFSEALKAAIEKWLGK